MSAFWIRNKKFIESIVELYKHAGFFKNMREVLGKHEPQADASHTSQVFSKNPKCLYIHTCTYIQTLFKMQLAKIIQVKIKLKSILERKLRG